MDSFFVLLRHLFLTLSIKENNMGGFSEQSRNQDLRD